MITNNTRSVPRNPAWPPQQNSGQKYKLSRRQKSTVELSTIIIILCAALVVFEEKSTLVPGGETAAITFPLALDSLYKHWGEETAGGSQHCTAAPGQPPGRVPPNVLFVSIERIDGAGPGGWWSGGGGGG